MKTAYNDFNIMNNDNSFEKETFKPITDEDISRFFNLNFLEYMYIEKYNGFFYEKANKHIIYYVDEILSDSISPNAGNRYISSANNKYRQEQRLGRFYNKYQPSNTVFIGNISFDMLIKYYYDSSFLYNGYYEIIVGPTAYDIYNKALKHYFPVFIDVDIIKEQLHYISSLNFEELYTKII